MYCELRFRVGDSKLGTLRCLGAVVDARQILNVAVQLFYTREESAYHDALALLQVVTYINLLTFHGVFIEDGLQMKRGAFEKVLICLTTFLLVLAAT